MKRIALIAAALIPVSGAAQSTSQEIQDALAPLPGRLAQEAALALSVLAVTRDLDVHLVLTKSAPGSDEVVASPHEIRLWFSDEPDEGATSVRLSDAEGRTASVGNSETSPDDPMSS